MAIEQNTAGSAPSRHPPAPIGWDARPPNYDPRCHRVTGRAGPAHKGRGAGPFSAGTHRRGAGWGGEEVPDYSSQEALRRRGARPSLASQGACGGARRCGRSCACRPAGGLRHRVPGWSRKEDAGARVVQRALCSAHARCGTATSPRGAGMAAPVLLRAAGSGPGCGGSQVVGAVRRRSGA